MAEFEHLAVSSLRGELRRDEPMHRHVSWKAGGTADRAYVPADLDDLRCFLRSVPAEEPVLCIGLGSNLLVRDGGIRGTVILLHRVLSGLWLEGADADHGLVYAQAGVASPKVARFAANHDLLGAEFLAGIPGTVGGALAMNAGCFGSETWEIVDSVVCLDRSGRIRERTPADYGIGYRHVTLKDAGAGMKAERDRDRSSCAIRHLPEEWFVAARLRLRKGDGEQAKQTIRSLLTHRIRTQPLNQPNAGSVFRNPPGDFAARLIESCGLKGFRVGGAQVSPKHANFIVNTGGASATDIEAVIDYVERTVLEKTGIRLQREVRVIGEVRQ